MEAGPQAELISQLRLVATNVYAKEGMGIHARLLGRAILALSDSNPYFRAAIATELDLLARSELRQKERELINSVSVELRVKPKV